MLIILILIQVPLARLAFRRSSVRALLCVLCVVSGGILPAHSQPKAVVVLCEGLSAGDLRRDPALRAFAERGAIGLMNTAVAGSRTDTSAMLTLALGYQAPSEPTDEECYHAISERVEGDRAGVVFRRRTLLDPLIGDTLVHLGIAPLMRRGLSRNLIGALAPGQIEVYGCADTDRPGRRACLLAIDATGRAKLGDVSVRCLAAAPNRAFGVSDRLGYLADCAAAARGIAVVHLGDMARADAARAPAPPRAELLAEVGAFVSSLRERLPQSDILLISPRPVLGRHRQWDRLSLLVWSGPSVRRGLLSSATTRTPGVVANIDVAPTLLRLLGAPPGPSMTGHPITASALPHGIDEALRLDRIIWANGQALVPVFALLGGVLVLVMAAGLWALARGVSPSLPAAGLLFLMNMPLAMLVAAPLPADAGGLLGGCILLGMAAITAVEMVACRCWKPPAGAPLFVALLTSAVIIVDALAGQPLQKFSLLASYQLQGIRYYGIGNEYMGVLVGVTLFIAFCGRPGGLALRSVVALFATVLLVIGLPAWGADAGGVIGATVAFGCALLILRGRRPGWREAALLSVLGLALAVGIALLDRAWSGGAASHIGGALGSAGSRGYGYLAEVAWRKELMNLRILTNPITLLAIAGVAVCVWAVRRWQAERLRGLLAARSGWAAGLPAAGWGSLATFVFNDSGIVAALFLFGAFFVTGLYYLMVDTRA